MRGLNPKSPSGSCAHHGCLRAFNRSRAQPYVTRLGSGVSLPWTIPVLTIEKWAASLAADVSLFDMGLATDSRCWETCFWVWQGIWQGLGTPSVPWDCWGYRCHLHPSDWADHLERIELLLPSWDAEWISFCDLPGSSPFPACHRSLLWAVTRPFLKPIRLEEILNRAMQWFLTPTDKKVTYKVWVGFLLKWIHSGCLEKENCGGSGMLKGRERTLSEYRCESRRLHPRVFLWELGSLSLCFFICKAGKGYLLCLPSPRRFYA